MPKPKNNFFVVWIGAKPGIYTNWQDCQRQVIGYPNAKYKGFKTEKIAKQALHEGPDKYWGKETFESTLSESNLKLIGSPIKDSISVDAAWNSVSGDMEYQGVKTDTKEILFQEGPFPDGTNNVGEFLAIVHGLAYLKKIGSSVPVYSDSRNAISWVKDKHHRSMLERTNRNNKIFELLERAERWLNINTYPNQILKWETKAWGENPADFGRK